LKLIEAMVMNKRTSSVATMAMLTVLGGCATVSQSPNQDVMVRTILDNREIGGAGCVLTNDAGRWFVNSPGHVTIRKSAGILHVDCRKGAASAGQERFASRANNAVTIGNVLTTAGFGYYLDKQTGAGFDYPETLTVLMRAARVVTEPALQETPQNNVVY
jgi:hypothetical protein